jgi:hypothetical protein
MSRAKKEPLIISELNRLGIDCKVERIGTRKLVTMDMSIGAALEFLNNRASFTLNSNDSGLIAERIERDSKSFCGGTFEDLHRDLTGGIDMTRFHEAKTKFSEGGLYSKLKTKMQAVRPRRARCNSEHDGEWSMDRQWELKPFSTTTRVLSPGRVIDIDAAFCVSAFSESKDLNTYGAMAWALCNLVETFGVQTGVTWSIAGHDIQSSYRGTSVDYAIKIRVKKPGQYLPANSLAALFQSNFFRRIGFGLIVAAGEAAGAKVAHGLGCATSFDAVQFSDGTLKIAPNSIHAYDNQIETEVLKAIA